MIHEAEGKKFEKAFFSFKKTGGKITRRSGMTQEKLHTVRSRNLNAVKRYQKKDIDNSSMAAVEEINEEQSHHQKVDV